MFVSLQLHLWRLLFIRALQHCSGRDAFPTGHCCSAKQARSMLVSLQLLHLHTSAATTASDTVTAAFGGSSKWSKFAVASGAQATGLLGAQTSPVA